MFLLLAVLEIVFPSNHEWAVAWVDSGAPLISVLSMFLKLSLHGCVGGGGEQQASWFSN